jgi:hypothetical protein
MKTIVFTLAALLVVVSSVLGAVEPLLVAVLAAVCELQRDSKTVKVGPSLMTEKRSFQTSLTSEELEYLNNYGKVN